MRLGASSSVATVAECSSAAAGILPQPSIRRVRCQHQQFQVLSSACTRVLQQQQQCMCQPGPVQQHLQQLSRRCTVATRAAAQAAGPLGYDELDMSGQGAEAAGLQQQQHQQQPHLEQQQQQHHQQQQQHQQHQQHQPLRRPLLSAQHRHHATVLANAWGESERRAALAALVKASDSVDSLAAVWLTCRGNAGPAELAVLFNRLAAVCEPREMSVRKHTTAKALVRELLIASEDKMTSMVGPEFVYIIAALAKLRAAPDTAWLNRWFAVSRHRLNRLSPAQLVVCLRALHRLVMTPSDVRSCIAFPAWMHNFLACLRPRLAAMSGFELVKLLLGFGELGYKPARHFLTDLAAAVEPKLSGLDSVYLSGLLSGFSALKYEPEPAFMRAVLGEVYAKLPLFDDKDLAAALSSFCSMRRLLRGDFLADFVTQVATKLPTFNTKALVGVVAALGQLGYNPGPEWFAQVTAVLKDRLPETKGPTLATLAWGLASCGYDPEPWFVQDLMAVSSPRLPSMDMPDLVMLVQALSRFSYRPAPGSADQKPWLRWFERVCFIISKRAMHPKQVLCVLEALRDAGVPPDPQTVDHLLTQLVQGGMQHAPVNQVAGVLELLQAAQHEPGKLFVQQYAHCIRVLSTSLPAAQLANAMRCLALNGFDPANWWLVQMLAITHARVLEFDTASASSLLWAATKLCERVILPSEKWSQDVSNRFWEGLSATASTEASSATTATTRAAAASSSSFPPKQQKAAVLTPEQLGEGLWGAVMVGFKPSEDQWAAWEAVAAAKHWALPLEAAKAAVLAYKKADRIPPRQLSTQLNAEYAAAKQARREELRAAAEARAAAAEQLRVQQQRLQAATAAIAAHEAVMQQQQQQRQPVAVGSV